MAYLEPENRGYPEEVIRKDLDHVRGIVAEMRQPPRRPTPARFSADCHKSLSIPAILSRGFAGPDTCRGATAGAKKAIAVDCDCDHRVDIVVIAARRTTEPCWRHNNGWTLYISGHACRVFARIYDQPI